jgi:rSAM/selenodomain-associated transferase 2
MTPPSPAVSIIVPVFHDAAAAAQLLAETPADPRAELIVVDGGGNPGLADAAGTRGDVRLVASPAGRARQMNAGAAHARGEWLLFLHADSRLPAGWLDTLTAAVRRAPTAHGGWFSFALDDRAWQARLIESGVRWRVRMLGLPYGDQGLFVRRRTFEALGGYRDMPLMEDVEFVRRLRAAGRVIELPASLRTSARRWRRDGWARRSTRNVALVVLYFAGVSPDRLARWYAGRTNG